MACSARCSRLHGWRGNSSVSLPSPRPAIRHAVSPNEVWSFGDQRLWHHPRFAHDARAPAALHYGPSGNGSPDGKTHPPNAPAVLDFPDDAKCAKCDDQYVSVRPRCIGLLHSLFRQQPSEKFICRAGATVDRCLDREEHIKGGQTGHHPPTTPLGQRISGLSAQRPQAARQRVAPLVAAIPSPVKFIKGIMHFCAATAAL